MIKKIATTLTVLLMFFGCSTTTAEADKPYELPKIEYYGAHYSLSYNEYEAVCAAVMSESGGETYEGQQAVAQCILNACELTGMRPLEVLTKYQYADTDEEPTQSVREAVLSVFTDGETVRDEKITIFYSPENMKDGYSEYHESQKYVCTIGGHRFFVERV